MASSTLVERPSPLPMKKILGNFKSLSILSSVLPAANSCQLPEKVDVVRKTVAPRLMLPPEFDEINNSIVYKFYRLAERDVKEVVMEDQLMTPDGDDYLCLGSLYQGWLVYIQQKDCQVFLFNPLSGKKINLPSVETLPAVTGVVRNSQSGLIESFLNYESLPLTPLQMSRYIIKTMVLSSSPMDDDCVAMAIYDLDRLAFCRRPGGIDADTNCWIALDGPLRQYTQLVFHSGKKLFFALTEFRELEAWDLHKDPIKRFLIQSENFGADSDWPTSCLDDDDLERKSSYCWDTDYLVYDHQARELFIVTRYTAAAIDQDGTLVLPHDDDLDDQLPYKTLTFDVFKVDFINDDHVELQYLQGGLGNRAFFIGSNTGFALSTTGFPELKPNSIYFTDNLTWAYTEENLNYGGHDLGIYDDKDRSILSCYYPADLDKIQRILPAPIWFNPDVYAESLA